METLDAMEVDGGEMRAKTGGGAGQPWVEKYRPRTVQDVASQEEVVRTLLTSLETANMPHFMFYGPPGTGKTSTALALCKQLYGPSLYQSRVLELNASDERSISIVRNKIKQFAAAAVGQGVPGYPCPPYKILILDEADAMTVDAQSALRRTMEQHSKVTRFCFICNYITRMIDPIVSRCAKFRFQPLATETMQTRLEYICGEESVTAEAGTFEAIMTSSRGDMRRAITILQSTSSLFNKRITAGNVQEVAGFVPRPVIDAFLEVIQKGPFDKAKRIVLDIEANGYSALQFLIQLQDAVMEASFLKGVQMSELCAAIADMDARIIDGADEGLQLLKLASVGMKIMKGMPRDSAFQ